VIKTGDGEAIYEVRRIISHQMKMLEVGMSCRIRDGGDF